MTDAQLDRIVAALERLPQEIASAVAQSMRAQPDPEDDFDQMTRLFVAIDETVSSTREFSVAELLKHAELPLSHRLREAILAIVGSGHPGITLGKALFRAQGVEYSGLRVERIGQQRSGAIWILRGSLRLLRE